jgi:hypothetical protein
MDSSEQRLLNDDGMQAPLLTANDEDNEDFYRIETSLQKRKGLSYFILIEYDYLFRWYSCSIC